MLQLFWYVASPAFGTSLRFSATVVSHAHAPSSSQTRLQTGGFFLIGFMLSGVMADYKESEKLPAEITAILETFEETGTTFALMKDRDADVSGYRRKVLTCLNAILKWLSAGDKSDPRYSVEVWAAINKLTSVVTAVYDLAGPPNAARLLNSLTDLRRFLLRLGVISSTTYLPHGYVLVELFVLMALVLVTLGRYASSAACYSVLVFVSLIFVYVYLLLTDADDPFEYHEIKEDETATGQTGSAEIDLSPLLDYRVRLRSRLAADDAHAAALAAAVAAAAAASNQPLFIITEQP